MLTLLMWLMMHGQAQSENRCYQRPASDGCNIDTVCRDMFGQEAMVSTTLAYCGPGPIASPEFGPIQPLPAPVEHVIEIRTKRQRTGKINYCMPAYQGDIEKQECGSVPEKQGCPKGAICVPAMAVSVTRELWIDGAKFGVVKGLD